MDKKTKNMSDKIYYFNFASDRISEAIDLNELIIILYHNKGRYLNLTEIKQMKLSEDYADQLVQLVSSNKDRIPLYVIKSNRIYLIQAINVYPRIYYENYRFVTKELVDDFKRHDDSDNLRIIRLFDIKRLKQTYFEVFYNSFVLNSFITSCKRPSFQSKLEHISPYYDISELYFLALDWGLIKGSELKTIDNKTINKLCNEISQYDISSDVLLDHQEYIANKKAIGLVKNYSLFGSYFINKYLRDYACCLDGHSVAPGKKLIKNAVLENQIKLMIDLIARAPAFKRDHVVYRFIETDSYLSHLNIGDTYTDPSFMSTTRKPFSYQENYNFGYILLKIKIPANVSGIGLCIESFSNFPSEEEIIFPPTSLYELVKISTSKELQHNFAKSKLSLNKVKKKYEFVLKGNAYNTSKKISIYPLLPDETAPPIQNINMMVLLNDVDVRSTLVSDRLNHFVRTFLNENAQVRSVVNGLDITFTIDSYDSESVYGPFFYSNTRNGLLMYSFNPTYGNINIFIELGPEMHINYYFRYSLTDTSAQLDLNHPEWIKWLSLLAYVTGARKIIIHPNYVTSKNAQLDQIQTRYTHSADIYLYLTEGKKMFSNYEMIVPNFEYSHLEMLFKVELDEILNEKDNDEVYAASLISNTTNIADFYVYVVDNIPLLLSDLENKIKNFYDKQGFSENPFASLSYSLDPWTYLLDTKLITYVPPEREFGLKKNMTKKLITDQKIRQFRNRIRSFLK